LSFFAILPSAAGSVVIDRLFAAAEAFISDGIARDVGFFCFFLGELARPAKIPFTPRVISQPKMGRLSKTGRRSNGNHLTYKTPTTGDNNRALQEASIDQLLN
jgi:F420-0:gamma-glutamyl ligase-like protein